MDYETATLKEFPMTRTRALRMLTLFMNLPTRDAEDAESVRLLMASLEAFSRDEE